MNSKKSEELGRLEHELKETKIKRKNASEYALPAYFEIIISEGFTQHKKIEDVPELKKQLDEKIKFLMGQIELLKLDIDVNGDNLVEITTSEEKPKKHFFHWNLGMLELQNLYDALVNFDFIDRSTVTFDIFINIFESDSIVKQNNNSMKKIKWLGKQNEIVYLIGRLAANRIIMDVNHWIAVESNFINKNSESFEHKTLSSIFSTLKFPKNTAKIDSIIPSANQKIEK